MYVSPISALFPGDKSTPAKRAIYLLLSLSLFVFRVDANDAHHTFAVDHLAFIANLLDRRSYLHKTPWRALGSPTSYVPRTPPTRPIVSRQLHLAPIARNQPDEIPFCRAHQMGQNLLPPFQHHRIDGAGPLFHHRGRYLPAPACGLVSTHGPFSVTAMQCSK